MFLVNHPTESDHQNASLLQLPPWSNRWACCCTSCAICQTGCFTGRVLCMPLGEYCMRPHFDAEAFNSHCPRKGSCEVKGLHQGQPLLPLKRFGIYAYEHLRTRWNFSLVDTLTPRCTLMLGLWLGACSTGLHS